MGLLSGSAGVFFGTNGGTKKPPKPPSLTKPASTGAALSKPVPNFQAPALNYSTQTSGATTPSNFPSIQKNVPLNVTSGSGQVSGKISNASLSGKSGAQIGNPSFSLNTPEPSQPTNNFLPPPPSKNNYSYSNSSSNYSEMPPIDFNTSSENNFGADKLPAFDTNTPSFESFAPVAQPSFSSPGVSYGGAGSSPLGISPQLAALKERLKKSKDEYNLYAEPTEEEKQLNSQLDNVSAQIKNLNASADLGLAEISDKPIALQFIAGQKAALERSASAKAGALSAQGEPLAQRLARLQADRQMRQEAKKNEISSYESELQGEMENARAMAPVLKEVGGNLIEYDPSTGGYRTVFSPQQNESYKPIEVGSGGTLVDPRTGKVIYSSTASQNIKPTDDIQEFNLAKGQGFKGSFVDFKRELANLKEIGSAASNLPASYKEYQLTQSNPGYGQYLNKNTMGGNESSLNEKQMKQIESSTEAKKLLSLKDLQGKLQAYRDAAGQPGGFESFGPRKALLDSLYADLKISYKEAAGLGALTGPDVAIITEAIKPISGATNYPSYLASGGQKGVISSIDQALSSAKRQGQLNYDSLLSRYKGLENDPYIQNLGQGLVSQQSNRQNDPLGLGFNQPLSTGENGSLSGLAGAKLGQLSEKYESGGNPGAIGYDNTGGWSYGKYQLAHNNAQRFVDQSPFKQAFQGLTFNSPQWRSRWQEVAKKYPNEFAEAQDSYITQNWYTPLASKAMQNGLNLGNYSPVLKDVIFSTAVQHGAGTDVVEKALARVGNNPSEADIIKAIYNERWSGGRRFANSTPNVKQSVYNRFFGKNGELNTALSQLS